MLRLVREDYERHGGTLSNPAFVAPPAYCFGRLAIERRNPLGRWIARRAYGIVNVVVANVTKVQIPPQVTIGVDFHIIHAEGSLSIHSDVAIGDRVDVMHNVMIGANMGPGAPVIGDVFVGTNATVLGPIRVGDRVRIAANTAVATDAPSGSVVVASPAKIRPRLTPFAGRACGPRAEAFA